MNKIILWGVLLVSVMVLIGCKKEHEVSALEFQALLARNPETMRHTEFAGVNKGKAYLKVTTLSTLRPGEWSEEYFVVEASSLPQEWLRTQLDKGEQ